jgi:hypothetical protein
MFCVRDREESPNAEAFVRQADLEREPDRHYKDGLNLEVGLAVTPKPIDYFLPLTFNFGTDKNV